MKKWEESVYYTYYYFTSYVYTMGTTKFTIKISQEEDKSFYAEVVELPGCFSAWATLEELKINIKEAMQCYLEWMQKDIEKENVSFDYRKQYV